MSDAGPRRAPRVRLAHRLALLALLLASVWLFLSYLSRCDREGRRTLFQLNAPMEALLEVGAFVSREAEAHVAAIRVAVLALAVVGSTFVIRRRRRDLRRALPSDLGLSLLALSAALFLPPPLRLLGFLASLAAGASLLFLEEPPLEVSPASSGNALFLIPMAIAVALRFSWLAEIPQGFSEHPVVHHVNLTLRYLEGLFPLLRAGDVGTAVRWMGEILMNEHFGFMSLLSAFGFKLLGVSLVTARLLSATAGSLTVLVAYFVGTQLADRRVGFLFSFLLAVSPWHVSISRYGDLEHVLSPLQLLLALGFYAAAVRYGRLKDYLFAAVALGLSWFVYAPNLVVPLAVGLHLVVLALRPGFLRRDSWKVAAFALLFGAISYGPASHMLKAGLLKPGVRTGYDSMGRVPLTDITRNRMMLAAEGRQLFVRVRDSWFDKPGGGLSLTETALFLPGILLCMGSLFVPSRRWSASLLLVALPLSVLPAVLAPDESIRRLFLTTTLALLLAALVLSRALDALDELGFSRRSVLAGVALFATAVATVNAHVYFDQVRVESEEGAVYLTEMSKCVKASLGKEFTYICVSPRTEIEDYHRYVRLAAYEPLRELAKQGWKREDLYEIVFGADIFRVLKEPRRIGGRFRILAEERLVTSRVEGVTLREVILREFPRAEEEIIGQPRRVVTSWRIR